MILQSILIKSAIILGNSYCSNPPINDSQWRTFYFLQEASNVKKDGVCSRKIKLVCWISKKFIA